MHKYAERETALDLWTARDSENRRCRRVVSLGSRCAREREMCAARISTKWNSEVSYDVDSTYLCVPNDTLPISVGKFVANCESNKNFKPRF